jgi:hypothetical protein
MYGKPLSFVTKEKLSKKLSGSGNPMFGKRGKDAPSYGRTGDKNPAWKGGVTPRHVKERGSDRLKRWRTAIFTRDNFTCRECGAQGVELNAHHIKSFSAYPDLRFDIDNGLTLCVPCHRKTDNWCGKNEKRKQKIFFIGSGRVCAQPALF